MSSEDPGWVIVPALLDEAQLPAIQSEMRALLALPSEKRRVGDKPASGTRHLEELDQRSPAVARLVDDERLKRAVRSQLGAVPHPVQVSYRSPQPGYGAQRLHADDVPRLSPEPTTVTTAIIALTDFTPTNGATRLIPGSHLRPDLQRQSGQMEDHPDAEIITVDAGSAIVFNGHLLHSGTLNVSAAERPALQIIWRR